MKILFIDTETTGIPDWKSPSHAEHQPHIVQVAALLYDADQCIESFCATVCPDGWTIPPETIRVHGITMERAMVEGIQEHEALSRCIAMHDKCELRVMHNKTFDQRIFRIAIKRFGHGGPYCGDTTQEERDVLADIFKAAPSYCTMFESRKACALPRGKVPTLREAHRHWFGVELDGAHDAASDAQSCANIYFAIQAERVKKGDGK